MINPDRDVFLMNHGRPQPGILLGLSDLGRQEIEMGIEQLVSLGIGESAILLSSTEHTAKQSSDMVRDALNLTRFHSLNVSYYGRFPAKLDRPNVPAFFNEELEKCGAGNEILQRPLVVITHAPFIAAALGLRESERKIPFGLVAKYEGLWTA